MSQASTGLMVVGLAAVVGAGYYIIQQREGQTTLPTGGDNGALPELPPAEPVKNEVSNLDVSYAQV